MPRPDALGSFWTLTFITPNPFPLESKFKSSALVVILSVVSLPAPLWFCSPLALPELSREKISFGPPPPVPIGLFPLEPSPPAPPKPFAFPRLFPTPFAFLGILVTFGAFAVWSDP